MDQPTADPRLSLLVDGIVRLSRGDLSSRIEPSPARDDVDAVITGVNLLAEELELVYRQFEQRVADRTAMLHQAHLDMKQMAMTDALTGLSNRVELAEHIDERLKAHRKGAPPPALLLLDLDSFKNINDRFGHDAGDGVLREVADRLRRIVRPTDTVARLGGDEFAILVADATMEIALAVANRALEVLSKDVNVEGFNVHPRASIGLRVASKDHTAGSLLSEADTAMYAAKNEGRSTIKAFEPVMLYSRQLRTMMASELRDAIGTEQLRVLYQPVVNLRDGSINSAEVLVRWEHPTRGTISPELFIPLAEEIGAISDLDRWVMTAALQQYVVWQAAQLIPDEFQLRVNISAIELRQLDMVDFVRGLLKRTSLPAKALVIEITESAFVGGGEVETYTLLSLKQLGVCIEIDDFGTGYSSISYLRRLPVDMVKVDRSILREPATGSWQPEFVAAVFHLISAAGLGAVFEGIETAEQAEFLRSLGNISGQGYYFSKPLAEPDITSLLRSGSRLPLASSTAD
ncbi:EAL domain-containing protein [Arthrobacter sp. JZ12]|nr:EAL domain-containing protein [Arthrobacter sp. JZ12]